MGQEKTKEQREKEREEYLNLLKKKQDLEDPTKKPAQRVSGWGSKLKPVKPKNRMNEKLTIIRRKMP